ncbi:MAG: hypothetical protein KDA33_09395 [Phycisphaerales bacterium]|nr:hypothetical protein [Phycisphaerales bacterium]
MAHLWLSGLAPRDGVIVADPAPEFINFLGKRHGDGVRGHASGLTIARLDSR